MIRFVNTIAASGFVFALAMGWPHTLVSGERPITRGIPSTDTIKKELTRGISKDQDFKAQTQSARPTMDIIIPFEFNSADLTPFAKRQLDAFGEALTSDELSPYTILVVGHTDDGGAADYNQELSERRARSVYEYLVQNHTVQPQRLVTRGAGEAEPFNRQDPTAPENRRVTFINKGP